MSFWESMKKFTRPYSDEDYDDFEDELDDYEEDVQEPAPRSRRASPFDSAAPQSEDAPASSAGAASSGSGSTGSTGFTGTVLNMNSGKQEVILFHAKSIDDAAQATDELRKRKAIVLNMENVDKAVTRRVVDFLSGSVYALDGTVKKIAQATYMFCPPNMAIVGDLDNVQSDSHV